MVPVLHILKVLFRKHNLRNFLRQFELRYSPKMWQNYFLGIYYTFSKTRLIEKYLR